jgi:hypothetical protein
LGFSEAKERLGPIEFNFVYQEQPEREIGVKLKFLYKIGFFGIEASREYVTRFKLLQRDVFWFNERDECFDAMLLEDFQGSRFVLHPVFVELLSLNTTEQRMTADYDWDYVYNLEPHMFVSA